MSSSFGCVDRYNAKALRLAKCLVYCSMLTERIGNHHFSISGIELGALPDSSDGKSIGSNTNHTINQQHIVLQTS